VAELVLGLGIDVRTPDPRGAAVLIEVHRPEGVILVGLLGTPYEPSGRVEAWARTVNEDKDRAESGGDRGGAERIAEQEREELRKKLAPEEGAQLVSSVDRASRLRRLLLAVDEAGDAARRALYEELRSREIPLLVIVDPKTQGARLRSWPGGR